MQFQNIYTTERQLSQVRQQQGNNGSVIATTNLPSEPSWGRTPRKKTPTARRALASPTTLIFKSSSVTEALILFSCIVFIAAPASSQAPSSQEQQYLFAVLPLIEKGQLQEAKEKLLEGLKLYPGAAILSNALGIVYERQEEFDAAVKAYRDALEALPRFTAAQLHLALLYQRQEKKREAAKLFNLAVSTTSDFEALSTAGLGLAQCEDYAGAVRALEKAQSLRPDSISVAYNLALAHFKNGDFHSAQNALGVALARSGSEDADVIFLRGRIKQALNEDGSREMAEACRLNPAVEHFCAEAGLVLIREERLNDAHTLLQTGLKKSGPSPNLLSLLGLVQFRLGKYADAIAVYQQVLHINPEADEAREGLSFLLYITGNLSQARQVVEGGLKRSDSDFYLSQIHAMILFRLSPEAWDEALVSVKRALEKNPQFAPSYFLRGKIAMERGQLESAIRDLETAARLDPKYPLPHYKLAQTFLRLGKSAEAEAARTRFFELGQMREEELIVRQTQDVLMRKAYRSAE